jgi:hypothetical protein
MVTRMSSIRKTHTTFSLDRIKPITLSANDVHVIKHYNMVATESSKVISILVPSSKPTFQQLTLSPSTESLDDDEDSNTQNVGFNSELP